VVTRVTPIQKAVMSHRRRQQSTYDNKPKKEKKDEQNEKLPLTLPKNCGTLYK